MCKARSESGYTAVLNTTSVRPAGMLTRSNRVRVMIAHDFSINWQHLIDAVAQYSWGADSEFKILSVLTPLQADMQREIQNSWQKTLGEIEDERRQRLEEICVSARDALREKIPDAPVHYEIRKGEAKSQIIDAAVDWHASKIIVGAKSRVGCDRFMIGSVANAVASHAPCSVEIVRKNGTSQESPDSDELLQERSHVPSLQQPAPPPDDLSGPEPAPPPAPGPSPLPKPDPPPAPGPSPDPKPEPEPKPGPEPTPPPSPSPAPKPR